MNHSSSEKNKVINNNITYQSENKSQLDEDPSCFSSIPPTTALNYLYSQNTEKKEEFQEQFSFSNSKQGIINDDSKSQSQNLSNISQYSYIGAESPSSKSQKIENEEISNPLQNESSDSNKSKNFCRQSNNHKNLGTEKKIQKRSAGRPLKKNFANAEKQKQMKEFDYEKYFGSQHSSENYQLLVTSLLIFGQDVNNGNTYIVKKPIEGDKHLNVAQMIEDLDSQESKRMWLTYYKISRILNQQSKELMNTLWIIFQQYIEKIYLVNCRNQMLEEQAKQEQQSMISTIMQCPTIPFKPTQLDDIDSIKKLFNSSDILQSILSDQNYHLFTNTNFGLSLQEKGDNSKQDPQNKFDYSELEKTLLISNNLTQCDLIYILFSCAICEYFNVVSPYFQILCNML